MLSLSADGSSKRPEESAIVWATHPTGCKKRDACGKDEAQNNWRCWCDANLGVVPGTLRAVDAWHLTNDSLTELWNSDQDATGIDRLGSVAKFTPVTVAGGRVYAATSADPDDPVKHPAKLVVYGIIPSRFLVIAPSTVRAGTAFKYMVRAVDDWSDNPIPSYNGTVHFTSSDPNAALPPDSKLTNGVGAFSSTLKTIGSRTITATDTVRTHITGGAAIAVSAINAPGKRDRQ